VILGNPIHDKTITSAHSSSTSTSVESDSASPGVSDHGRGSGCSCTAPALSGPVARTIYYLAAELIRLVGSVDSMKPVLQSLYHRVLLYPPPQHRVEAIKIMKEVGRRGECLVCGWDLSAVSRTQYALNICHHLLEGHRYHVGSSDKWGYVHVPGVISYVYETLFSVYLTRPQAKNSPRSCR
jgi:hypothetical protein